MATHRTDPCSRELAHILHLNKKAEIQCIGASVEESGFSHYEHIVNDISQDRNSSAKAVGSSSLAIRSSAGGLVEYIVERMSAL